jgi:hypothetical protein
VPVLQSEIRTSYPFSSKTAARYANPSGGMTFRTSLILAVLPTNACVVTGGDTRAILMEVYATFSISFW